MRKENKQMQEFLKTNGIRARVKYIWEGSLAGCWRLYEPKTMWYNNQELIDHLTILGFRDFNNKPLNKFSGNGGIFSIFARCNNII